MATTDLERIIDTLNESLSELENYQTVVSESLAELKRLSDRMSILIQDAATEDMAWALDAVRQIVDAVIKDMEG